MTNLETFLAKSRSGDNLFLPPPAELFFTKNDPEDLRLGEIFKPYSGHEKPDDFILLGYPDDEGIKLNGGRVGASEAPNKIRQFFYKMTPPESFYNSLRKTQFFDYGNLEMLGELFLRHDKAQLSLDTLHQKNCRIISLGGGHDYGYSDGAAFLKKYVQIGSGLRPLIINFDAHLDVRKPNPHFNSGTPFYRLLSEFKDRFDLIEIGLQPQCNSVHHLKWAQDQGVETYFLDELENSNWPKLQFSKKLLNISKNNPVFVSFDIDALTAAEAGGCSQAWATGLKINDCLQFLKSLYQASNVRHFGIYEVSPPLDKDFQTSKTAALLAYHYIFHNNI